MLAANAVNECDADLAESLEILFGAPLPQNAGVASSITSVDSQVPPPF